MAEFNDTRDSLGYGDDWRIRAAPGGVAIAELYAGDIVKRTVVIAPGPDGTVSYDPSDVAESAEALDEPAADKPVHAAAKKAPAKPKAKAKAKPKAPVPGTGRVERTDDVAVVAPDPSGQAGFSARIRDSGEKRDGGPFDLPGHPFGR